MRNDPKQSLWVLLRRFDKCPLVSVIVYYNRCCSLEKILECQKFDQRICCKMLKYGGKSGFTLSNIQSLILRCRVTSDTLEQQSTCKSIPSMIMPSEFVVEVWYFMAQPPIFCNRNARKRHLASFSTASYPSQVTIPSLSKLSSQNFLPKMPLS